MDGTASQLADDLPDAGRVDRICCLMLADIGDVLVTTPTLELLRTLYPRAHIRVVLRSTMARLLAGNPNVDSLIVYRPTGFLQKIALLVRLGVEKADLWVDLHTPTFNTICPNERIFRRNDLLKRICRPRNSVGFLGMGAGSHTHGVAAPDAAALAAENVVITTARLVKARPATSHLNIPRKFFHVFPEEAEWAQAQLPGAAGKRGPLLGFFFGSNQPADVWPLRHCVEWIQATLRRVDGAHIVIVGGAAEERQAQLIVQALSAAQRGNVTNLANRTTLGRTAAVVARCAAFVTTDSGPLHIADALSVPMVALFSSKNFLKVWSPWQSRARVLNVPVACGPCFRSVCPEPWPCIERIAPLEVVTAVEGLLSESS